MRHLRDDAASRAINHLKLRRSYEERAIIQRGEINREGRRRTRRAFLKVGRQVEGGETVRKVRKKRRNRRERDSADDCGRQRRKRKRKKRGTEEENDSGAARRRSDERLRVWRRLRSRRPPSLSPPPDKHRFAYDRHFAGSII